MYFFTPFLTDFFQGSETDKAVSFSNFFFMRLITSTNDANILNLIWTVLSIVQNFRLQRKHREFGRSMWVISFVKNSKTRHTGIFGRVYLKHTKIISLIAIGILLNFQGLAQNISVRKFLPEA